MQSFKDWNFKLKFKKNVFLVLSAMQQVGKIKFIKKVPFDRDFRSTYFVRRSLTVASVCANSRSQEKKAEITNWDAQQKADCDKQLVLGNFVSDLRFFRHRLLLDIQWAVVQLGDQSHKILQLNRLNFELKDFEFEIILSSGS